ncbi:MAG: PorT family protein [Paraprevotella sp.]|nr:PorT family protein [Paraprevotella sp.]
MKRLATLVLALAAITSLQAQERKLQNRPYIDQRRFHYGFSVGLHMQDLELMNSGYADPVSGEQWYAETDNYNPGFSVGVLGEARVNSYLALRLVPTIHFGQKHISFHEQVSQRDTTQNIKSTYISVPLDLKFSAPRFNNYRPYFIAGVNPMVDLTVRKHNPLLVKRFDCFLEVGMGCDFYLPFFKLIPELKFCFGLANVLQKKRDDLMNRDMLKYTDAVDRARAKMIVLTLYFE